MEFGVLGPVEVSLGGALAPKPRWLLSVLLCHPNVLVGYEDLVEILWGDDPPESARANVRVYVSQLRRALVEEHRIVSRRGGYQLMVRAGELDASRFEELVSQGRAARDVGDLAAAVDLLRQALALWRGPAFADVEHRASIGAAAAHLDELRLAALEERMTAELALGRHTTLLGELKGLVNAHPFREGLHALLMKALYRSGRRAEALEAFRHFRAVLREQLGVEPGPRLQRLHEAVLRGDTRLDEPGGEGAGPLVPRELPIGVTGFTGRGEALKALQEMLPDASSGDPVVISAIAGTAGVGKTALAVHWLIRSPTCSPTASCT